MSSAIEPISPGVDVTSFGDHLLQLVGEPFLFSRRSYGDELVLHYGERLLGPVRRNKHGEFRYEHGTHSLHLRGSAWVIKGGRIPSIANGGFHADPQPELADGVGQGNNEREPPITPGARVTAAIPFSVEREAVKGFGLRIDLADGSSAIVLPTPEELDEEPVPVGTTLPEIADWELRTPHGILVVGPGLKWEFTTPEGV